MKPLVAVVAGAVAGGVLGVFIGISLGRSVQTEADAVGDRPEVAGVAAPAAGGTTDHARADSEQAASTLPTRPRRSLSERLQDVMAIDSDIRQRYEAEQLFENMRAADAPEILAMLLEHTSRTRKPALLGQFFARWGEIDGPAALEAAKSLDGRLRVTAFGPAATSWAKTDPYRAWEAVKEYANAGPMMRFRGDGVVSELAKRDLPSALATLGDITNQNGRSSLRSAIIRSALENGQIESVLAHAAQDPDAEERKGWMNDIFRQWGEGDLDAPLNALAGISDPALAQSAMNGFLNGWAQTDSAGATEYVLQNRSNPLVADAMTSVLRSAFQFQTEAESRVLLDQVIAAGALNTLDAPALMPLAMSYPQLAMTAAEQMSDERQRRQLRSMALSSWVRNDFETATTYFTQLPAGPEKSIAFSSMVMPVLQRGNGAATLAGWVNEMPAGSERSRAASSLISAAGGGAPTRLSQQDRRIIFDLAASIPDLPEPVRQRAQALLDPP